MKEIKVTGENTTFHFVVNNGKLCAIHLNGGGLSYFVNENNSGNFIPMDLFERAMEVLLRAKPGDFDIVSLVAPEPYSEAAVKVYKKVMDELYNLAIAEVAFKRHSSSIDEAINATYTLFEEE